VCTKGSVTLTVGATGTNLSYQWRRNGENLPGATASSLFLSNVTSSDAGNYDVVVNSSCGFVISSPAKIDVHAPPVVTLNSITTCPGTPVVLTATHDAGPDATFFWLPGEATTPTLTVSPLTTTGYSVRVTSAGGCWTEASTVVTVFDSTPPTLVQCPPDRI